MADEQELYTEAIRLTEDLPKEPNPLYAIKKELEAGNPDIGYISEKVNSAKGWLDMIERDVRGMVQLKQERERV
jgi:hypothetical protein